MAPLSDLLPALQKHWGYDSFRPLQDRIVKSILGGADTCVVMPTGGGKSLCYQLPALVLEKTAIVVSPLIALMQDQVAQLEQMGIPAAVLNSAITGKEQSQILRNARDGAYRLLYLSPERIAREDSVRWLRQLPVSFFAIDEAHCISEWGHEFRPEYRELKSLRVNFPDLPIAAFTASATRRVRHDILEQLQLRNPHKYIASFHRPNLRYVVRQTDENEQQQLLIRALQNYREGSVIVYSPTIVKVEQTVELLEESGIPAVGYHAKMDTAERRRNQERWMSDEVRVLVGTIAFGLGINKAAVRAVIHLFLPRSVEQFYQEAGRAGRDGLPADCVLLWQARDASLIGYFNNQISDSEERERAWDRYREVRAFADGKTCRHRQICVHFGEIPKWQSCGACDGCGSQPEWLAVPVSNRPKRSRRLRLPEPAQPSSSEPASSLFSVAPTIDHELREYLREWRRTVAKEQKVSAFVVMHDSTLEWICQRKPRFFAELRGIPGLGERKLATYGQPLLDALERFRQGARAQASAAKTQPAEETRRLVAEGLSPAQIADRRGRQLSTVVGTIAVMVEAGDFEYRDEWVPSVKRIQIEEACQRLGTQWLKPLKAALPDEISFEEIRLVVAKLRRESQQATNGTAV
jgi:ATP-dependent DNA helicase RecQ